MVRQAENYLENLRCLSNLIKLNQNTNKRIGMNNTIFK